MYVEEGRDAIRHSIDGREYFFCTSQCLNEFTEPEREHQKLKQVTLVSSVLTGIVIALTYSGFVDRPGMEFVILALATPVQFWAGLRFYRGTVDGLRSRASNMDTLVAIGTSAAYLYSAAVLFIPSMHRSGLYFDTSCIIVTLILTGRLLETRTKQRAWNAVHRLLQLQPAVVTVVRQGREEQIPVEHLMLGDVFIVKPGERVATDGLVLEGYSQVDESAVTGESIPVEKATGSQLIGGTMNKAGLMKATATKVGQDTVMAQIISSIQEARVGKAPMQRTADKVAKYFVPAVVAIAIGSGIGWYLVGGIGTNFSLLAFVSVIIISCPCALGIATPAALMMGSARAAESGILFKSGEALEIARRVDTIAFDKTGTLTKGRLELTEVILLSNLTEQQLLLIAAGAESGSEHPIGKAIVMKAKEQGLHFGAPEKFEAIPGIGLKAAYSGHQIEIGSERLIANSTLRAGLAVKMASFGKQGKTAVIVMVDGLPSGILVLADSPKDNAASVVHGIKKRGIRVAMLTGDSESAAAAIAADIGIEEVFAGLLPQEKEAIISRLQEGGKRVVAMVGDGINDAPALARADLGIALGSGTDVAMETGDVVLIKNDLSDVTTSLDLARETVKKIRQNLFWAFCYNIILIPIAAGALVPLLGAQVYQWLPWLAAAAMAVSSVTVVANSLLLGKFRPHLEKPHAKVSGISAHRGRPTQAGFLPTPSPTV